MIQGQREHHENINIGTIFAEGLHCKVFSENTKKVALNVKTQG